MGLLSEARYTSQAQPIGLRRALTARGCHVELIDPAIETFELGDERWLDDVDVVVARGRSTELLYLLRWAEERGHPTVNRHGSTVAVRNKAEMAVTLRRAGIPTPATWLGAPAELAARLAAADFPLILKPIFGDNCRGLRVIEDRADLANVGWPEPTALAQRYLPSSGIDLKLYGIGAQVWAVRKLSPLGGATGPPEPIRVTREMAGLARSCSRLFGLELYGVDCLEGPDGAIVVEVNEFPNYTAVPDADERLADHVLSRSRERRVS